MPGYIYVIQEFLSVFFCVCVCLSVFRTQKVKHFAMQKWECHCATLSVFFSACPCKCDHAELYTSCLHIACVCACMGAWVRAWACVCVAIMCFLVFISKNMSEVAFFASSITVHTFQRIDMHTCACVCVCVCVTCMCFLAFHINSLICFKEYVRGSFVCQQSDTACTFQCIILL